jgi:hypothetical protein
MLNPGHFVRLLRLGHQFRQNAWQFGAVSVLPTQHLRVSRKASVTQKFAKLFRIVSRQNAGVKGTAHRKFP